MAVGGLIGMSGAELPLTEIMIALSGLGLGLAVALEAKPPLWIAALLTGIFAVFHGYAHGTELPESTGPLEYAAGFFAATVLLHLCGIGLGVLTRSPAGAWAIRAGGAAIGCAGAYFLIGAMEIAT
jgi:urease accessory protein